MLILFDVDGTLLMTRGGGLAAMQDAGRELFGAHFTLNGIETAGRLDRLIWADAAAANGIDAEGQHDAFRAAYAAHFAQRLDDGMTVERLMGVAELLEQLQPIEHMTCGLLTGNYAETGRMKIEAAGLKLEQFLVQIWGGEGSHRRDLPPLAIERYAAQHGRSIAAESVVIVGDTPHDVDCAHHHGCRAIGVATGRFTVDELAAAGADHVVENLARPDAVIDWLLKSSATTAEQPLRS